MILTSKTLYLSICMVDVHEISNSWPIQHWSYVFVWWTILKHHILDLYNLVLKFPYGGPPWSIIYLTFMTLYLSFSMVDDQEISNTWPIRHCTYRFVWWTILWYHKLDLYDLVLKFPCAGPSWNIIYLTFMTLHLHIWMVDDIEISQAWPLWPCT